MKKSNMIKPIIDADDYWAKDGVVARAINESKKDRKDLDTNAIIEVDRKKKTKKGKAKRKGCGCK